MRGSRLAVVVALLLLVRPPAAFAQQDRPAQAAIVASLRLTSMRGREVTMAGGEALLRVGRDFSFGGAGYLMLQPLDLSRPGSALQLRLAYGGVETNVRLHTGKRLEWTAGLLAGAGNAKAVVPVVGTELRSDNFGVLEPQIMGSLRIVPFVSVRIGAGYRYVYGVNGIPRVSQSQLRGFSFTGSMEIGWF